jgi:hypothetical protein
MLLFVLLQLHQAFLVLYPLGLASMTCLLFSCAQTLAKARKYIRDKLGIFKTTSEEEAARIITASVHAQDYHMDKTFLCNLRT